MSRDDPKMIHFSACNQLLRHTPKSHACNMIMIMIMITMIIMMIMMMILVMMMMIMMCSPNVMRVHLGTVYSNNNFRHIEAFETLRQQSTKKTATNKTTAINTHTHRHIHIHTHMQTINK